MNNKYIKIIFTISLILNVMMAGVVLGGFYKRHYEGPKMRTPSNISAEGQQILRDNMKANRSAMRDATREMKQSQKALQNVIAAENFDRVAYEEIVKNMLQNRSNMSQNKAFAMGDVLEALSQADREKMAKRLFKGIVMDGRKPPRGEKNPDKKRDNP